MTVKATAEKLIEYYNAHDIDGLMGLVAPDVEIVDHPMATTLGHDDVHEWFAEGLVTFPDARLSNVRHIAADTTVVTTFVEEATHGGPLPTLTGEIPATGRPISLPICFVLDVGADGLIHAGEMYYDMDSLLRQVA